MSAKARGRRSHKTPHKKDASKF